MSLHDDLPADEQEDMPWWKFLDCGSCANRMKKRTCNSCDNGEFFLEEEPEGLDDLIRAGSAW